jgi:hypothetical protein
MRALDRIPGVPATQLGSGHCRAARGPFGLLACAGTGSVIQEAADETSTRLRNPRSMPPAENAENCHVTGLRHVIGIEVCSWVWLAG